MNIGGDRILKVLYFAAAILFLSLPNGFEFSAQAADESPYSGGCELVLPLAETHLSILRPELDRLTATVLAEYQRGIDFADPILNGAKRAVWNGLTGGEMHYLVDFQRTPASLSEIAAVPGSENVRAELLEIYANYVPPNAREMFFAEDAIRPVQTKVERILAEYRNAIFGGHNFLNLYREAFPNADLPRLFYNPAEGKTSLTLIIFMRSVLDGYSLELNPVIDLTPLDRTENAIDRMERRKDLASDMLESDLRKIAKQRNLGSGNKILERIIHLRSVIEEASVLSSVCRASFASERAIRGGNLPKGNPNDREASTGYPLEIIGIGAD